MKSFAQNYFARRIVLLLLANFSWVTSFFSAEVPTIKVGYYIKSIKVNNKEESAEMDFYYWYRFPNIVDSIERADFSSLEFVNGDISMNEIQEEKVIGNEYYITGRIKGNFRFTSDYVAYPFDKQKILIQLEHAVLTDDQVLICPDTISYLRSGGNQNFWGISDGLESRDIFIRKTEFYRDKRIYKTDFGDVSLNDKESSYSRLSFFIYIERNSIPYTMKFLLPLIIILSLAYLVFYIPAEDMELACGLTVTSLLAAIAFQWTLSDDLPSVGYLTCVDKIFYLGYSLIMLAMVQTVWTYHLEKDGKMKLSNALEIAGRWLFPIIFFSGVLFFIATST
jgi:hypothetical protein